MVDQSKCQFTIATTAGIHYRWVSLGFKKSGNFYQKWYSSRNSRQGSDGSAASPSESQASTAAATTATIVAPKSRGIFKKNSSKTERQPEKIYLQEKDYFRDTPRTQNNFYNDQSSDVKAFFLLLFRLKIKFSRTTPQLAFTVGISSSKMTEDFLQDNLHQIGEITWKLWIEGMQL